VQATINPTREDVREAVVEATDGVGLDGVILTVVSEAILAEMQRVLRPGGRINIFAGPSDAAQLSLDVADLYQRELSVFSTYSSTPAALAEAFDLLAGDRVWVAPLISHRLPLTAFDEGVELQKSGQATKVIFHP
jgi:threonine dehydrogenase-like Zn-dependent dehydrogenase